jgi:hypothetical protein
MKYYLNGNTISKVKTALQRLGGEVKKIEKDMKTIGVEELAILLHRKPKTLMQDIHRRPDSLPPRLIIPCSKRVLWLEQDVLAWINNCRA